MRSTGIGAWRQWPRWVKGPALIEGDEVVLDGDRAEEYVIHKATDLPFDLAMLAPLGRGLDPERVTAFVRRYGLLWHGPDAVEKELRESLDDWRNAASEMAFTVEQYRRLSEAVRTNSVEPVRRLIDAFSGIVQFKASTGEEYLAQLSAVLAEQMTTHLQKCTVGITAAAMLNIKADSPGRFLMVFHPPDLVSAAYVQLAVRMVSKAELAECPGCGRIFQPKSGKQEYCNATCSNTARTRRFRERRRAK